MLIPYSFENILKACEINYEIIEQAAGENDSDVFLQISKDDAVNLLSVTLFHIDMEKCLESLLITKNIF